jgi:hypothetical protein
VTARSSNIRLTASAEALACVSSPPAAIDADLARQDVAIEGREVERDSDLE